MDFRELFNTNRPRVKNIIKLVTSEENEDLEQEVYLKAYKNRAKYTERGRFSSWLAAIAYNVSRDYLKSAPVRHKAPIEEESVLSNIKDRKATPEERLVIKERQERITGAINGLNKKLREVIIMSEIEHMTYETIAKKLKCPVGTVKSRIYNAKKELFQKLQYLIND